MQRQGRHERRCGESRETEDLYAGRCRQGNEGIGRAIEQHARGFEEFRVGSSELRGCQDTDYLFVARMRNSKVDKQVSDQYIVATYDKDGKILNLEVGPPEFSAGNLQSYCR